MKLKLLAAIGTLILTGSGIYVWRLNQPIPGPSHGKPDEPTLPDRGQVKQPAAFPPAPLSLLAATEFLHTGPNAVQHGLDSRRLAARRAAVLRGIVFKDENEPLADVRVTISQHPEYGTSRTRSDGTYDMLVNAAESLAVRFQHEGYLPVWRQASATPLDSVWLPPVVLTRPDQQTTTIRPGSAMQIARGSKVKDKDGTRQATLLFPPYTRASLALPDGVRKPLDAFGVRITEYTVGKLGPERMPAPLPNDSAYTYCVELGIDDVSTARFKQPVYHYVENFLGFPVGSAVPAGYFDSAQGMWIPSASGQVIQVLAIKNDVADLDVAGSGRPADETMLQSLQISIEERRELARLYAAGTSLWRVPIFHSGTWGLSWGGQPPADAMPPRLPLPTLDSAKEKARSPVAIRLPGIAWKLNHSNDRTPSDAAARTIRIPITDKSLPKSVQRVLVEVCVAGRYARVELPANPDQVYVFLWDGKDAYGRPLQSAPPLHIRIGYVYDGVYERTAAFGAKSKEHLVADRPTWQPIVLWQDHAVALPFFDARVLGLGGWSLDVQHAYDPVSRTLYLGTGERLTVGSAADGMIASPNGKELYRFNADWQHVETLDPATQEARIRLSYDRGALTKIEEVQTKVQVVCERDTQGRLQAIVLPSEVRMTTHLDFQGRLEKLIEPNGQVTHIAYAPNGLLQQVSRAPKAP